MQVVCWLCKQVATREQGDFCPEAAKLVCMTGQSSVEKLHDFYEDVSRLIYEPEIAD